VGIRINGKVGRYLEQDGVEWRWEIRYQRGTEVEREDSPRDKDGWRA